MKFLRLSILLLIWQNISACAQNPHITFSPNSTYVITEDKPSAHKTVYHSEAASFRLYESAKTLEELTKFLESHAILTTQQAVQIWEKSTCLIDRDFMLCYQQLHSKLFDSGLWKKLEDRLIKAITDKDNMAILDSATRYKIEHVVCDINRRREASKQCKEILHKIKSKSATGSDKDTLLKALKTIHKNKRLFAQINHDIGNNIYANGVEIALEKLEHYQKTQQNYKAQQVIDFAVEIEKLESIIPELNAILKSNTTYKSINDSLQQKANQVIQDRFQVTFTQLKHIETRFGISLDKFMHPAITEDQLLVQKDLVQALHSFSQVPSRNESTELLMASTVRNLSKVALDLNGNKRCGVAREIIDMLNTMSEIFRGSYNRLLPDGFLSEVSGVATGLAAHGTITLGLNFLAPQLVIPYNLGFFLYGLTQTKTDVVKNIRNIYEAIEKQNPYQFGESLTGLTIDALNTRKIHKAIKNAFLLIGKHAKMEDVFTAFKHGFNQREQHVESTKQALTLSEQIKNDKTFTALLEQAAKLGSSAQAIQRRVVDLCRKYEPKDVLFKLKEINDALAVTCDVIPKGLLKKLKFDIDHLLRLEFDSRGAITGWHFDKLGFLFKYAKVEILEKDVLPNGMYYAKYKLNGRIKKATYFCNKRNDSVTLMQEVMDTLNKIDYSKVSLSDDQKYYKVETPFQGAKLIAYVDKITSEVKTFYPFDDSWRKYFEKP
jgi:hypothetical protein